jgi:hypothetical protein
VDFAFDDGDFVGTEKLLLFTQQVVLPATVKTRKRRKGRDLYTSRSPGGTTNTPIFVVSAFAGTSRTSALPHSNDSGPGMRIEPLARSWNTPEVLRDFVKEMG